MRGEEAMAYLKILFRNSPGRSEESENIFSV
jgi:hypothetical protein